MGPCGPASLSAQPGPPGFGPASGMQVGYCQFDSDNLSTKAGVKADLVSRLCDALAPVAIAKRTGEASRETKLAELRALKVPEQAAVRPARRA